MHPASQRPLRFAQVFLLALLLISLGSAMAQSLNSTPDTSPAAESMINTSEGIHHLAGYALIGSALLIIVSQTSPRLRFLQAVWPFLFLTAGVFLMAWSDGEIWPRGSGGWLWMLKHDPEARQHKIFALLLILMSGIEYLRWRQKLSQFWSAWAFPALAAFGAILLLFHVHVVGHETQAMDMRGNGGHRAMANMPGMDMSMKDMDMKSIDMKNMDANMKMDSAAPGMEHMGHVMTPTMLRVQREHLWFTIVGLVVALFKFASDGFLRRVRALAYAWPSAMGILGILLLVYRE